MSRALALASPSAASAGQPRSLGQLLRDIVALTKPRITFMVVVTFAGGAWLAPVPGAEGVRAAYARPNWLPVLIALIGTTLIVSAANALNMYWERDIDGLMERTKGRPLPQGRMEPQLALTVGAALAGAAVPLLYVGGNALTCALGVAAFVLYVFAYTPLKRRTWLALFVGAVPGALPPLMGWTTVANRIDASGLALFAVLFLWQIPHFLAIAIFRETDYLGAGFRILSYQQHPRRARLVIAVFTLLLVAVTFMLPPLGVAGRPFLVAAALLGGFFTARALAGYSGAVGARAWARSVFFASIVYLTLLFIALAIDHRIVV